METAQRSILLGVIFSLSTLAGCAITEPARVDEDFGNSVRNMIDAQIYNPEAARNPPTEPPLALDGPKAEKVLEVYRDDVAKPRKIEQPIRIEVGD